MSNLKEQDESLLVGNYRFTAFLCDGCNAEIDATHVEVKLLNFLFYDEQLISKCLPHSGGRSA